MDALALLNTIKPEEIRQIPQDRYPLIDIGAELRDGMRFYMTPFGDFPSVTTVLGSRDPKLWLYEWRDRIGNDRADKIVARACQRGERMHLALEERLRNNPKWLDACETDAEAIIMAKCIAEDIMPRIDRVLVTEGALYSPELRVAGRVDCVAVVDKKPAIVDFKNSRRIKTAEDIPDYFMQTALYSRMLREMTGIKANDMYVAMAIAEGNLGKSFVFHERYEDWIGPAEEVVDDFWKSR